MFFILSKILAFLFSPLTWIIGLFLFSLFSKNPVRKRKSLVWGVVTLLFFSNTFIFDEFSRWWEYDAVAEKSIGGPYETGIVLGSFTSYDLRIDRLQLNRGSDRLWQAIDLYRKGRIKKIFYVGGSGRLIDSKHKDGDLIKKFLVELGIPADSIMVETASMNTRENA